MTATVGGADVTTKKTVAMLTLTAILTAAVVFAAGPLSFPIVYLGQLHLKGIDKLPHHLQVRVVPVLEGVGMGFSVHQK